MFERLYFITAILVAGGVLEIVFFPTALPIFRFHDYGIFCVSCTTHASVHNDEYADDYKDKCCIA